MPATDARNRYPQPMHAANMHCSNYSIMVKSGRLKHELFNTTFQYYLVELVKVCAQKSFLTNKAEFLNTGGTKRNCLTNQDELFKSMNTL